MALILQETNILCPKFSEQIRQIWNNEYPVVIRQNSQEKFDAYIKSLEDATHTLVLNKQNMVQGWYADFQRENDLWFVIILSSNLQGKGIGKQLIQKAQKRHKRLNGWAIFSNQYEKADKNFYKNPIGFYEKMGFHIRRDIIFQTEIMETLKIEWRKLSI